MARETKKTKKIMAKSKCCGRKIVITGHPQTHIVTRRCDNCLRPHYKNGLIKQIDGEDQYFKREREYEVIKIGR